MKIASPLILLGILTVADLEAQDLLHGQFTPYFQRHAEPDLDQSGYTAGFLASFVFASDWSSPAGEKQLSGGWLIETEAGAGTFDGDVAFDLLADIFGLAARYRINGMNQIGFTYDPIVVDARPTGGYLGSKLILKYLFGKVEFNLARGADGFFYGCFVPTTEDRNRSAYSGSIQYLFADDDSQHHQWTVGTRYTYEELTDQGSAGDHTANGMMLFAGWLF